MSTASTIEFTGDKGLATGVTGVDGELAGRGAILHKYILYDSFQCILYYSLPMYPIRQSPNVLYTTVSQCILYDSLPMYSIRQSPNVFYMTVSQCILYDSLPMYSIRQSPNVFYTLN